MGALGSLVVSLTLENQQFTDGLKKSEYAAQKGTASISLAMANGGKSIDALYGRVDKFASKLELMSHLGIAMTAAWGGLRYIGGVLEEFDKIGALSDRFQVNVETMQALGDAAEQSQTNMETLGGGLNKLNVTLYEASHGNVELAGQFKSLGIDAKTLSDSSDGAEQALYKLADRIAAARSPAEALTIATKILGKSAGPELIPLLSQGGDALRTMADEARRTGRVLSAESMEQVKTFNDEVAALSRTMKVGAVGMATPFITELNKMMEASKQEDSLWGKWLLMLGSPGIAIANAMGAGIAITPMERAQSQQRTFFKELSEAQAKLKELQGKKTAGGIGSLLVYDSDITRQQRYIADVQAKLKAANRDVAELSKAEADAAKPKPKKEGAGFDLAAAAAIQARLEMARIQEGLDADASKREVAAIQLRFQEQKLSLEDYVRLTAEAADEDLNHKLANIAKERAAAQKELDPNKRQVDLAKLDADAEMARRDRAAATLRLSHEQWQAEEAWTKEVADHLRKTWDEIGDPKSAWANLENRYSRAKAEVDRAASIISSAEASNASQVTAGLKSQVQATLDLRDATGAQGQAVATLVPDLQAMMATFDAERQAQIQAMIDKIKEWQAVGAQKGWVAGMKGGLDEYARAATDTFMTVKDATVHAMKGMEDALLSFVKTGKLNFATLADSIISDLIRIQIQESITKPLASAMSGINWGSLWGSFTKSANGNVFASAGLHTYANSIVSRPTLFPFARGVGLMGEAGPEAIMPLKRGPDGKLGVSGGVASVQVNVINNATSAQATARERSDGQGNRIIDVLVEQVKGAIAGDIARGAGPIPAALGSTYGLNRVAGAY